MSAPIAPAVMIDLEAAKLHLREDRDDEDSLIETLIAGSYGAIERKLFRKIYATAAEVGDDLTGLVVDHTINSAVLLTIGHLWTNREAVKAAPVVVLPMGVEWLIESYRDCAAGY